MKNINVTVEVIRSRFDYNPETGEFVWKQPVGKRCKPGQKAGSVNAEGYLVVGVNGISFLVHKVIWFYMTGHWPDYPDEVVDHIDRVRLNNRWSNLRLVTVMLNQQNRSVNKNSSTGVKGVSFDSKSGTYYVQKQRFGHRKMVTYIKTLEEARKVYDEL